MKASVPVIAILALLALAGGVLFFVNQDRIADQEAALQEQMKAVEAEKIRTEKMRERLSEEEAEKARLAEEAREARLMAEAQAEKERREREKLVDELNERLAREAAMRREAEEARKELQRKMADLEAAQREAETALAQLESARAAQTGARGGGPAVEEPAEAVLKQTIEEQATQLAALEEENKILKEQQEQLEEQQIETEEAILTAGGKIKLPYPEIRSPNVRRRQALYFKERVAGHSAPGE